MNNLFYQNLLTILQYMAIATTGGLGIFALSVDYKDKSTGQLTKNGRIARFVLFVSVLTALSTKTLELILKNNKDASDAYRARVASEQTLRIAKNTERLANQIKEVDVDLTLAIRVDDSIFKPFAKQLKPFEDVQNDRDLTIGEFRNLVPHNKLWKKLVDELSDFEVCLDVYPEKTMAPTCVVPILHSEYERENEPDDVIKYNIPFRIKDVSIPQMQGSIEFTFSGRITPEKGPQVLSLIDFNSATTRVYPAAMVLQKIENKRGDYTPGISYNRIAPFSFYSCNLTFTLNAQRRMWPEQMILKKDSCSQYPYFTGKINLDPRTL